MFNIGGRADMVFRAGLILVLGLGLVARADEDAVTRFETKVRPVLAGTCFRCHGSQKTSGGLRVDSREALLTGGDRGPALAPGDPDGSLLLQAVRHADDDLKMPPDRRLDDRTVADLAAWVRAGAPWPEAAIAAFTSRGHWSFQPVRQPEPPPDLDGWSENPIDRFIAAAWRAKGLVPVEEADRRTLIRRLAFDLTGLPPTPEEIDAFIHDPSPIAYESLVDRLLASPRYGQRWGRHWLDVARYADTAGDNADYPVPEARHYRDWVIAAFNRDMAYDEFVRDQIAGDILARERPGDDYADRVIATTFLGLSRRYATAPFELWHLSLEDAIDTTGRAFLGLTLRCARCHDHKFDPVTTAEYYGLYGIFAGTTFPYAGSEEFQSKNFPRQGFLPLVPPKEAGPRMEAYRGRIAALEAALPGIDHEETAKVLGAELRRLKRPGLPPGLPGAYAVSEGTPTDVPIQQGGEPDRPGAVVPRGVPRFLASVPPPAIPPSSSGRKELAEWLTRPEHPLTARVLVNRLWQHHFGRGLVATPSNFGAQGAEPSHPELLDWLAATFVERGWSIKTMHRLIVTSRTYRLSSRDDSANVAIDPGNAFLWRHDRRRLDAEALRDAMLAVSGALNESRPPPHPFPSITEWGWTQHNQFRAVYPSNHRSVYLMTQRLVRHPYLGLFDGPDTNVTTEVRTRSTVPLQALYMMNSPFVSERAAGLAERLKKASADEGSRVALAYELAWNRPAGDDEIMEALAYLRRYTDESRRAGASIEDADREAWASLARVMLTANAFVMAD
jgi:hypothetical protein